MGRPLSAAEAKEAGIVNTVVDSADAVDATALKAAQEIAALPPKTVAVARGLMRGHLDEVIKQIEAEGRISATSCNPTRRAPPLRRSSPAESEADHVAQGKDACSSPAPRAASGSRSGCAPRATAPTWRSPPRPPNRIRRLPGTIYTAAEEIERAGGKALPLVVDVRDE